MSILAADKTPYDGTLVRETSVQTAHRPLLTPDGEQALREELERLRRELEVEFAARLKDSRGYGASHNNDDYLQIKEEEAVLEARIRRLEAVLERAKVIDAPGAARGVVTVGSVVEVRNIATDAIRVHRLTGDFEPFGEEGISLNSPVGRGLLGGVRGDVVRVEPPSGKAVELEILSVRSRRRSGGSRGR